MASHSFFEQAVLIYTNGHVMSPQNQTISIKKTVYFSYTINSLITRLFVTKLWYKKEMSIKTICRNIRNIWILLNKYFNWWYNFIDFFIFYKSEKFSLLNSILYKFVKPCYIRRLIVLYWNQQDRFKKFPFWKNYTLTKQSKKRISFFCIMYKQLNSINK